MKKFLPLIAITSALFLSSQANAKDGFYAGADLVLSKTNYKMHDKGLPSFAPSTKENGNGVGAGISFGYKKSFDQIFIAPEVFYEYLNNSAHDYYHNFFPYQGDTLKLRSRYGAKLNLGYDFNKTVSGYLTYGMASVDYITRFPSMNYSEGKPEIAPIYGFGAIFNINENWAVRAEFNQQKLDIRYFNSGPVTTISKVTLNVLKTGVVYSF